GCSPWRTSAPPTSASRARRPTSARSWPTTSSADPADRQNAGAVAQSGDRHRRSRVVLAPLTRSWTVMSLTSVRCCGGHTLGGFMRHRARSTLAVAALLIGSAGFAPVARAQPGTTATPDADQVKVFRAEISRRQVPLLLAAGQDGHELGERVRSEEHTSELQSRENL